MKTNQILSSLAVVVAIVTVPTAVQAVMTYNFVGDGTSGGQSVSANVGFQRG